MGRLSSLTVKRENLSIQEIEVMYRLMTKYYLNVTEEVFLRDLMEKDQVILMSDAKTMELKGFSTFMTFQILIAGSLKKAIFSGDTIIDREYWGEQELSRSFSRYLLSVSDTSAEPAFWFLICKGYKAYRYLPLNFKNFYPRYDMPTPFCEQSILDAFANHKFSDKYDKARGIVSFSQDAECLKAGIADVTEARMKNPHVQFFVNNNPGYKKGDELACLARLSHENFTKAFYRVALYKEKSCEANHVHSC